MKQCVSLFIHAAALRRAALVLIILAACQPSPPPLTLTSLPTTPGFLETATPSPVPTTIFTATASPTPTVEELVFPFTIDGLRQHDFQSGKIHIRSTLAENDRFTSYLIDYPSDGLTITGVMQIPIGEGPFPVILMNHGFFSRSVYDSGDGTDRASAFLAEHGYITLASDYRSWGDSDVGSSFFYSGLVIDVINLLNAIPSIKQADEERVGMWGHSMGGGVTMKALTIDARIKAAVLYSPVSADFADIIARWGPGCFGDVAQGELIVGCNSSDIIPQDLPQNVQDAYLFVVSNEEGLKKVSPFYYLDDVKVPIQIHYGTEDGKYLSGTPPQWSVKLTQGLRDSGKQVELLQYEGEGHSFIGQPWFDFMGRTLRFFDKYVK
ncbi:MAG TPA: alpha/beta fold hydrolase [Anaerolineales bacterium]|jgi:dipeptidyl aminopeptidase/acylaminoacyl peptidase|nr:alpha/beta fold hydrolase [Anaerolineales bacterium]